MPSIETLPYLLKELKLPAIKSYWAERAKLAETHHWSYGEFLADLLDMELSGREQRRLQEIIRQSKLPATKTLSNFDFSANGTLNAAQIKQFSQDTLWLSQAENLILLGPSGTGKTHIASAIGHGLIEKGARVFFSSSTMLIQTLQQAKSELKLKNVFDRLARFDLLILDDIGYVKKSEQETSVLFELINHRYETGSLLITANQAFGDWENIFPDSIMAVAAIDRLIHHATIIQTSGQSYRSQYAMNKNQQKEAN
jgi:DNA replication protein DnaC